MQVAQRLNKIQSNKRKLDEVTSAAKAEAVKIISSVPNFKLSQVSQTLALIKLKRLVGSASSAEGAQGAQLG